MALVFGETLGVTVAATTVTIATGDDITLPPVAVVFTAMPILLAAVVAVRYLAAMDGIPQEGRPTDRHQST